MTSIIQRYLLREILRSSLATTLVLFIILMSNTLGSLLSDIADGELPRAALWPALLGQGVSLLSMLLPLGLFLGVVFAFGPGLVSLWAGPLALQQAKQLIDLNRDVNQFEQLRPGHFNGLAGNQLVFYMQGLSADKPRQALCRQARRPGLPHHGIRAPWHSVEEEKAAQARPERR